MDFQDIDVDPHITVCKTIVKAQIQVLDMKLFESIRVMVRLLDENDQVVDCRILLLDKSNGYDEWLNDDTYVLNWVKKQLSG
jgi:hypothetical protein